MLNGSETPEERADGFIKQKLTAVVSYSDVYNYRQRCPEIEQLLKRPFSAFWPELADCGKFILDSEKFSELLNVYQSTLTLDPDLLKKSVTFSK